MIGDSQGVSGSAIVAQGSTEAGILEVFARLDLITGSDQALTRHLKLLKDSRALSVAIAEEQVAAASKLLDAEALSRLAGVIGECVGAIEQSFESLAKRLKSADRHESAYRLKIDQCREDLLYAGFTGSDEDEQNPLTELTRWDTECKRIDADRARMLKQQALLSEQLVGLLSSFEQLRLSTGFIATETVNVASPLTSTDQLLTRNLDSIQQSFGADHRDKIQALQTVAAQQDLAALNDRLQALKMMVDTGPTTIDLFADDVEG